MCDWKEPGSAGCASVLRPVETAKTDGVQLPVMKANTYPRKYSNFQVLMLSQSFRNKATLDIFTGAAIHSWASSYHLQF